MSLPRFAVGHRSIVFTAVFLLFAAGTYNFATMPRREDPEIVIRECPVITRWPGAPVTKVEELVTDPLEKAFGEIKDVKEIKSKSRVGLSVVTVVLEDEVRDADQYWDEVRAKVDRVLPRLPAGCQAPQVNSDVGDVYQVCLALHQVPLPGREAVESPYSPRRLEEYAERIEDELELIEPVAKVDFWGVRPERIYVEVDSADWAKLSLSAAQLQHIFQARNIVAPGGQVDTERGNYSILPTGEFGSVEQLRNTVVARQDGKLPVRIRDLPVSVDRRYEEPPRTLARVTTPELTGQPCIVIGIAMKSGRNIAVMDEEVRAALDRLRARVLPPDLELTRVNDLPRQVNTRIVGFTNSLIQGVLVVLAVALAMMGWRPAMVMATAVPLSMISAFAVVRLFDVQLEQFSIASLIIALGMVVDNAIVVSDNAFRLMREGRSRLQAVVEGAQGLAVPILTSTLTTVCAFLPMLTLPGAKGEYTRSLPIVVASTLAASYFVAMLVTPLMCLFLLKPKPGGKAPKPAEAPIYDRLLRWCLSHKAVVLVASVAAFVGALLLAPHVGSQFFPPGERDQFFIHVWLPEGAPLNATDRVCRQVERILQETSRETGADGSSERLAAAATFVGDGGPRFLLTQGPEETFPYYGFILVNTTDARKTDAYAAAVRARAAGIPGARINVYTYMFGPPVKESVAFRLVGRDADVLRAKAEEMIRVMRDTPGTVGIHSDWGVSGYQVKVEIDSDAANLAGVTNADVAVSTNALLSGAELTTFREGDHQVPVMFRTLRPRRSLDDLEGIYVDGAAGKVPVSAFSKVQTGWQPTVIARRKNLRTVTVGGRVEPGVLPNTVAAAAKPRLEELVAGMPPGYRLEIGGEQEETAEAQQKMSVVFAIAFTLIILVLVAQYNSVLKPLVILFTLPLAVIGVMVGLYLTGWAISFMVMLGIISLAGIVINNAIVLIDFVEGKVAEGAPLRDAMAMAGRMRMKPIVLTSLTTIGGLAPLALFGGPLWAGMACGMIFGLAFSTLLTLFVVPTLYAMFAELLRMRVLPAADA